jgi:hypothetical protein
MSANELDGPERSGRGRHRGEYKDEEARKLEDKAKGHGRGTGKPSGEEMWADKADAAARSRGHQKGFGRNQAKESPDRSTRCGTRAAATEGLN